MYTRDCYACINGESQFVFKVPFKLSCKCFKVYAADSIANVFWILGICVCCVYSDQGGAMKLSCSPLVINLYISKMPITDLYVSIKFLNKLSLWVMLFELIFLFLFFLTKLCSRWNSIILQVWQVIFDLPCDMLYVI